MKIFSVFALTTLMFAPLSAFSQAEVHYKDAVVDEIDVTGTGYYGRLLVAADFNKDGIKETIYLRMSQKYLDYIFNEKRWARRKDKAYHKKGLKLSKTPEWSASFVAASLRPNNSVGAIWEASFNINEACVHPSQIVPAHLNNDDFLDFIIPCHGYDAIPYPGEHSLVVLSDGVNNYNVSRITKEPSFYHDGASADFDGDGNADILLVDAKKLRVFLNDGDGTFTPSDKYFPQFATWNGAFSTEILDVNDDGHFDVFVAGHEDDKYGKQPTIFLLGNKRNRFSKKQKILVPAVQGYGVVLDVIKEGKNLFILRTGSGDRFYKGALVQHVAIESLQTIDILENREIGHIDRIFQKSDEFGRLKFGGFTSKESGIDFIFQGERMQPAY